MTDRDAARRSVRKAARILVVDDEEAYREFVAEALVVEGHEVVVHDPSGGGGEAAFGRTYDVAILDLVMPGTDGFRMRERVLKRSPRAQFIFITGYPSPEVLQRATDAGVFSFITKPFTHDNLRYAVLGALRVRELLERNREYGGLVRSEARGIVGRSASIEEVRRQVLEAGAHDLPVLVTGESGVGKEVVARCIHECGPRAARPFVAVNCGAFAASLIESELFGHLKGAFTGATRTKHGLFEVADGGSLLLDEIAELPLELQAILLRVLDTGEYRRVGEECSRRVDVRIVSATNQDLEAQVRAGAFRRDLYYRLLGGLIRIAPLRQRRDDIIPMARHFLDDDSLAIAPEAMDLLVAFDWPGNCRQLAMVIRALKAACAGRIVSAQAVAARLGMAPDARNREGGLPTYEDFRERVTKAAEREYFTELVRTTAGNMSRAAALARMDRKSLYRKLAQLDIVRPSGES